MLTEALLVILLTIALSVLIAWLIARRKGSPALPVWLRATLALFAVLGCALIFWQFSRLAAVQAQSNWPTTIGQITRSELSSDRNAWPVIEYSYRVDGKQYSGTSNLNFPGFGGRTNRQDAALKVIAQYAPGDSVQIHYDPQQHAVSVLKTGPTWDMFGRLGLGVMLLMISTILLALSLIFKLPPKTNHESLNSTLEKPHNGTHRRPRAKKMD